MVTLIWQLKKKNMKYYIVHLETSNMSANDTWNFKSKIEASAFAVSLLNKVQYNKDYWGDTTVKVTDEEIIFQD